MAERRRPAPASRPAPPRRPPGRPGGHAATAASAATAATRERGGPPGASGPAGPSGPAGGAGILKLQTVESPHVSLIPGDTTYDVAPSTFQATCPAGFVVVGTGFDAGIGNVDDVLSYGTFVGGFVHNDTSITITDVHLQAICAQLPPGVSSASAGRVRAARNRYQADLAAKAAALR